jgi:CheY-like chemotaxis protein
MNQNLILVAEDNSDEILLIQRAFRKARIVNPLHFVRDGAEAIAYLSGQLHYANRTEYPLPILLLLDLKMPRKDGFEVLRWVRSQPDLAPLRTVVLTSSLNTNDINQAYRLGANSFLVKPVEFGQLVELSLAIQTYWLWLSKVPETAQTEFLLETPFF